MMSELNLKFSQINSKIDLVVLQLLSIGGATETKGLQRCKPFFI